MPAARDGAGSRCGSWGEGRGERCRTVHGMPYMWSGRCVSAVPSVNSSTIWVRRSRAGALRVHPVRRLQRPCIAGIRGRRFLQSAPGHLYPDDARDKLKNILRPLSPAEVQVCIPPNRLFSPYVRAFGPGVRSPRVHERRVTAPLPQGGLQTSTPNGPPRRLRVLCPCVTFRVDRAADRKPAGGARRRHLWMRGSQPLRKVGDWPYAGWTKVWPVAGPQRGSR
jgi:hypothetical protein